MIPFKYFFFILPLLYQRIAPSPELLEINFTEVAYRPHILTLSSPSNPLIGRINSNRHQYYAQEKPFLDILTSNSNHSIGSGHSVTKPSNSRAKNKEPKTIISKDFNRKFCSYIQKKGPIQRTSHHVPKKMRYSQ